MTPLHLVAQNGLKELVKLLLENGEAVFARNNHDTVLHRAISGNNEEIIKLIINKIKETKEDIGPYIDAQDTEGDTPLMWAAEGGKVSAVKILLEYGADVNARNNLDQNALDWAVKGSYEEIVNILLDKQSETGDGVKNENGETII